MRDGRWAGAEVQLAGRTVSRVGVSLVEVSARGMWGEPADRGAVLAAVGRAIELGAGALEVPVPFGPAADLVREVGDPDVFLIARLTGDGAPLDLLKRRLGRLPDLILAPERLLGGMSSWAIPLGAIVGSDAGPVAHRPLAAVRGPYPPTAPSPGEAPTRPIPPDGPPSPGDLVTWCESQGLSYLAATLAVLDAGDLTVALPAVSSVGEVERVFAEAPTPPGGGPR